MIRPFLSAFLGALFGGVAVWLALGGGDSPPAAGPGVSISPAPAAAPASAREIRRLNQELETERARGRDLMAELDAAEAGRTLTAPPSATPPETPLEEPFEATGDGTESGRPWFDGEALEAAGWTVDRIERIRRRWERYAMEKLQIENERARKVPGWKQLGKRSFQVEVDARRDLGDEDYEGMRFAAGEPTRVVLTELLETSPAAEAGLLAGDEVISYEGQRVFTAKALKFLTQQGLSGAPAEIRVLRAGAEHRFFVPRGPLGTRLEAQVRSPYP